MNSLSVNRLMCSLQLVSVFHFFLLTTKVAEMVSWSSCINLRISNFDSHHINISIWSTLIVLNQYSVFRVRSSWSTVSPRWNWNVSDTVHTINASYIMHHIFRLYTLLRLPPKTSAFSDSKKWLDFYFRL